MHAHRVNSVDDGVGGVDVRADHRGLVAGRVAKDGDANGSGRRQDIDGLAVEGGHRGVGVGRQVLLVRAASDDVVEEDLLQQRNVGRDVRRHGGKGTVGGRKDGVDAIARGQHSVQPRSHQCADQRRQAVSRGQHLGDVLRGDVFVGRHEDLVHDVHNAVGAHDVRRRHGGEHRSRHCGVLDGNIASIVVRRQHRSAHCTQSRQRRAPGTDVHRGHHGAKRVEPERVGQREAVYAARVSQPVEQRHAQRAESGVGGPKHGERARCRKHGQQASDVKRRDERREAEGGRGGGEWHKNTVGRVRRRAVAAFHVSTSARARTLQTQQFAQSTTRPAAAEAGLQAAAPAR